MAQWFVAINGQPSGPMTESAVAQLAAEARIAADALVWSEGMDGWRPAGAQSWWPAAGQSPATPAWSAPAGYASFAAAGAPPPPAKPDVNIEHFLVPMNRSALSVAAGYLGLFSLVLIAAPLALVVSILALIDLRRRPHLLGRGRAIFGLVTGALGTPLLLLTLVA